MMAASGGVDIIINLDGINEIVAYTAAGLKRHNVYPAYPGSWESGVAGLSQPGDLLRLADIVLARRRRRNLAMTFSAFPLRFSVSAGSPARS